MGNVLLNVKLLFEIFLSGGEEVQCIVLNRLNSRISTVGHPGLDFGWPAYC